MEGAPEGITWGALRTAVPRKASSPRTSPGGARSPSPAARARFLAADRYRVEREWNRYEGTPQRDLFRELRERFLRRWSRPDGWAIDVGSGPLRFTPILGGGDSRRIALDLSREMLRWTPPGADRGNSPLSERVQGDACCPPFQSESFATVVVLGNALGFAGDAAPRLLDAAVELVAPNGSLLIEIAPGPGEHSRYLARLPATAVGRLLRSPPPAVIARIAREGFERDPPRRAEEGPFQRFDAEKLVEGLEHRGFRREEILAVAPALGSQPERTAAVRSDPKSWQHLLMVEETLGRLPDRWPKAAAVLLALARAPSV